MTTVNDNGLADELRQRQQIKSESGFINMSRRIDMCTYMRVNTNECFAITVFFIRSHGC